MIIDVLVMPQKPSEYVVAKKRVHVREPLVNPLTKDNNTGGVGGEEAKRRRGRALPERGVFQEKLTRRLDPIMST
jgi:hypothetical protein